MNPEQQRIAIAEACGWTECRLIKSYDGEQVPYGVAPNESPILKETPDYLYDLNAMHEAEEVLFARGWEWQVRYYDRLCAMSGCSNSGVHTLTLTAAQRAEAFLKTIGEWADA
jgi:hypothetical protein